MQARTSHTVSLKTGDDIKLQCDADGYPSPNITWVKPYFALIPAFLPAATKLAKVIFSQASVCPQEGRGVCLSACWDIPPRADTPPGADIPPDQTPLEQTHPPEQTIPPPGSRPPWEQTPPPEQTLPGSRLQHTVNERLVRILLECILVQYHTEMI